MAIGSMEKVKIIFIATPTPRQGGDFQKGDKVSLSVSSANRWIRRGLAITERDYNARKELESEKAKEPEPEKAKDKKNGKD